MWTLIFLAIGGVAVAILVSWLAPPYGATASGLAFFVLGLVLSNWSKVRRYPMFLIKAIKIMYDQDDHPEKYITPFIENLNLWPERWSGPESSSIKIALGWRNQTWKEVTVRPTRGTYKIGSNPTAYNLPGNMREIRLPPFSVATEPDIVLGLSGESLGVLSELRKDGRGNTTLFISIAAAIQEKEHQFQEFSSTGYIIS